MWDHPHLGGLVIQLLGDLFAHAPKRLAVLGTDLLRFRQIVNDFHTRQRCIELLAAAFTALVRRDRDALRGAAGCLRQCLGFVEQPGLIRVQRLSRRLLRRAAEQLRLQPSVLFLQKLHTLFARGKLRTKRLDIGGCAAGCRFGHARQYIARTELRFN